MKKTIKMTIIAFACFFSVLICSGCEADDRKQIEPYQAEENGILFLEEAGYQVFVDGERLEDMEKIKTYLDTHHVTISDVNKQIILTAK